MTHKEVHAPNEGMRELDIKLFPKWQRILDSYHNTATLASGIRHWNDRVNRMYAYIPEKRDYWKTRAEFVADGGGDCEDFAVYKFCECALPRFLAVGTLKDTGEGHAVLVVYSGEYEDWVVLDNMTSVVTKWAEFEDNFNPIYLCNQFGVFY